MKHSATHHAGKFTDKQKKIALFIVAFAFVMDLLDSTIVNIAIPSIQNNLGASFAMIQWLIAGYSLAFALLLITGGRMGDVFGYKKMFLLGVGGFTVASLLTGVAPNAEFLVFARLFQGAMAALMVPQVMSLMQVMYKPEERSKVMGLFGMLGGLAASLGPIVGGLLIKANLFGWDWRPIFLINLPVGIFAIIAGIKYLPEGKSEHPLHIDLKGTFLIILALSLLIFPLIEGRDLGWPLWTMGMLTLAIPAMLLFAWYENRKHKRDKSALIVPSLFKKRSFVSGLGLNILMQMAMVGYFLTITMVMQIGLGYSPLKAALTGIPTAVGMTLSFVLFGEKLIKRFGRNVISIGAVVFAAGLIATTAVVSQFTLDTEPWHLLPGLFLIGMGMALVMAPIFSAALQDVDPSHAGSASGIMSAIQQVGAAIGIAIIGVIFFGQLGSSAYASFDKVVPQLREQLTNLQLPVAAQESIITQARTCFHDRSNTTESQEMPESCKPPTANPADQAASQAVNKVITTHVTQANANNFANAFRWGAIYTVITMVVACALSFTLPRKMHAIREHA